MPTRISLIRHGETAWNVNGRWQGHAAVPLNDEGKQQAARLAERLVPQASEIAAIYASDLSRTSETASIIASRLGRTVMTDPRLREIDLGDWQGLTFEEVESWDTERYRWVQEDAYNRQRPGGESWAQVADRAVDALKDYVDAHKNEHILVVSHGGTIRCVLMKLALMEKANAPVGNTSLTALLHELVPGQADGSPWKLDVYNLMDHLDPTPVKGSDA